MHEFVMMSHGVLHPALDSLLHYFSRSALSLGVVGAAAWLGDRMLRRVGPQAQQRMWVAALLIGVALPLLPTDLLVSLIGHAKASSAGGTVTVTYNTIAAVAEHWTLPPLLCAIAAGVYLLTVLLSMARLLSRWRRAWSMVRRASAVPPDALVHGLLEDAARRFEVAEPEVRCSTETRGPVVLGLHRAMLLVSESFLGTENDEDVAAALAHECAHLARRDFAKNMIYECVAVLVAYHPACWLMRRRIAETRELVCDEMVADAVGDRPEYAASLLRLATAMAGSAAQPIYASGMQAIGVFDAGILEERIMRLTTDLPEVTRTRRIAMAALTACALLGGAATAVALSFDVMPSKDAATSVTAHEKIYKVGNGVTPPVLTYSVDAEFTKKAKDAKYQGVSVVSCVVDADGMPRHVHTIRKLGMGLDEKAIEAVGQYKFKPGTLNGKPVAVQITIEVNFHIY